MASNVTYLVPDQNRTVAVNSISQAARTIGTGKVLPNRGDPVPVFDDTQQTSPVEIDQAVNDLNKFVQSIKRELHFRIDEGSGRTVVTVLNSETDEVIRQLPPDEILALSKIIKEQLAQPDQPTGLLLETQG